MNAAELEVAIEEVEGAILDLLNGRDLSELTGAEHRRYLSLVDRKVKLMIQYRKALGL